MARSLNLPVYLGIDLGGTNIKAGIIDAAGQSLSRVSIPTEAQRGPTAGVANLCRAGEQAIEQAGVESKTVAGVGLATPGTMDIPAGMLLEPPNLPGWTNVPIRQMVQDHFRKPTVLQNDANAAAYGEYWVGAGRGVRSMIMLTLGTGIGGGIIVNDIIISGEHSHGSECGHIIIAMDGGRPCPTGQFGTLEAYASATALIERCREALPEHPESLLHALLDQGHELTPLLMAQATEQGDALAESLIMETARYLGVGTTSLMHTIDPNLVVFGGAMTFGRNETELGRRFLQRIRDEVKQRAFPVPYRETRLDYASLGGDAGYVGAAGWARTTLDVE